MIPPAKNIREGHILVVLFLNLSLADVDSTRLSFLIENISANGNSKIKISVWALKWAFKNERFKGLKVDGLFYITETKRWTVYRIWTVLLSENRRTKDQIFVQVIVQFDSNRIISEPSTLPVRPTRFQIFWLGSLPMVEFDLPPRRRNRSTFGNGKASDPNRAVFKFPIWLQVDF